MLDFIEGKAGVATWLASSFAGGNSWFSARGKNGRPPFMENWRHDFTGIRSSGMPKKAPLGLVSFEDCVVRTLGVVTRGFIERSETENWQNFMQIRGPYLGVCAPPSRLRRPPLRLPRWQCLWPWPPTHFVQPLYRQATWRSTRGIALKRTEAAR